MLKAKDAGMPAVCEEKKKQPKKLLIINEISEFHNDLMIRNSDEWSNIQKENNILCYKNYHIN